MDPTFPARGQGGGRRLPAGRSELGQGSSREHAALVPLYLHVRGVLAKSFARIHRANLINNGILPLEFANESDYDRFDRDDEIVLPDVRREVSESAGKVTVQNVTKGFTVQMNLSVTDRQRDMLLAGGLTLIGQGKG